MISPELEANFPGLRGTAYEITSPETTDYNCIAWAAADQFNWWQPDPFHQYFWPENAPRSYALDAYLSAFKGLGYEPCDEMEFEAGFEKVAIYKGPDGFPSHMARQLQDGRWTSKLGESVDIVHISPADLEGDQYGALLSVLRRPFRF